MLSVIILCSVFSSVALAINIVLLILMLRHTPRSFANFTIVLKFQAFVDIATILAAAAGMNRTIIIDHSYVFIAHGPCTLLSSTFCFASYGIMTMGASMTIYILLASFVVRLQIVCNRNPSDRFIIGLLAAISFPVPATFSALFHISRSEDSILVSILQEKFPAYSDGNFTIFGIEETRTAVMSISLTLMIIVIFPVYIGILYLRAKILESLHEIGDVLSEKTKHMHSQFVKMLTLQCVIPPVVFAVTMLPIHLESMRLVMHPIMEAMINILACLSTLLSPIVVLLHIVPYRRALIRWIKGSDSQSPCTTTKSLFEFPTELLHFMFYPA